MTFAAVDPHSHRPIKWSLQEKLLRTCAKNLDLLGGLGEEGKEHKGNIR